MPEMDGASLVSTLRSQEKDFPAIFVSGKADRNDVMSLIPLGIVDYIDKPINKDRLLLSVHRALELFARQEAMKQLGLVSFQAFADIRRILTQIRTAHYLNPSLLQQMEQHLNKFDKIIKNITQPQT
jgi:FixJ family two-component response regulator